MLLAAIPGFVIAVLFFFDHNVSSQLAQVNEFDTKKPSAYHWSVCRQRADLALTCIDDMLTSAYR